MSRVGAALIVLVCLARAGHADTAVDGGLVVGLPAALPTGLTTGLGAGITYGGPVAFGARVSVSTATEYALSFTVRQDDVRLRLLGALQRRAGRGTLALRLGLGGTLVHERRTRDQGERAGLEGDALETTTWEMLPAADLELSVRVQVIGAWGLLVTGGPSVELLDGAPRAGWVGSLGVSWSG